MLQAETAEVRQQLEGVRRAHRGHHVGVQQATFQVVQPAVPLHEFGRPHVIGQADVFEHFVRIDALESAVMDGQDAGQALQIGLVAVHSAQEHRHERGMPIVRVQDEVALADPPGDLDGG